MEINQVCLNIFIIWNSQLKVETRFLCSRIIVHIHYLSVTATAVSVMTWGSTGFNLNNFQLRTGGSPYGALCERGTTFKVFTASTFCVKMKNHSVVAGSVESA